MSDKEKKPILKYEDADSHFEAENLNKYDCLDLKDKNLIITSHETEYVDPEDELVKNIEDHPHVDFNEVKNRDPNTLFKKDIKDVIDT